MTISSTDLLLASVVPLLGSKGRHRSASAKTPSTAMPECQDRLLIMPPLQDVDRTEEEGKARGYLVRQANLGSRSDPQLVQL